MKEAFLIIAIVCLGGCVGYRISHVNGIISGTNIATPYGPANGNLQYDSTTCIGNCPKAQEVLNATHTGPTINTAK